MADNETLEEVEAELPNDREGREQAAALGSMTDQVPERQLDEKKAQRAMADLADSQKTRKAAERQREKELAAVKISKEDVDVLAAEVEVAAKVAERRLREHNGSLKEALKSYL